MRVVVVTPQAQDSLLARGFLEEGGVKVEVCAELRMLAAMDLAAVGCLVLVDECLVEPDVFGLQAALRAQPAWFDLPIVLVARDSGTLRTFEDPNFSGAGNITLLQRPLHPASLVSAVKVALRARARQYEVRGLLEQRERALRQRDEFLAMLAHELRNPLAPIRNSTYLLGTLDVKEPLFAKCRAIIENQTRLISRLVDDLLEVSRLELGKVELRRKSVDLKEVVASAAEAFAVTITDRTHLLRLELAEEAVPVNADPARLEQALSNLLANATKFTPDGGTITLETRVEGGHAFASVADSGVGIAPGMLDAIFDLFTQDGATIDRARGGLGVGLTVVKRLVHLHGGEVQAYSEGPNRGARFEIRLPLLPVEEASNDAMPASRPMQAASPARRRVTVLGE